MNTRSEVVLGVMPKRRKDSEIWDDDVVRGAELRGDCYEIEKGGEMEFRRRYVARHQYTIRRLKIERR